MPWVTIPNSVFEAGKPARAIDMRNLRDNFAAMAEGAPGAPRIQDAALNTGAATAEGIAWTGRRTGGLAVGAVGTYAWMSDQTVSGSGIRNPGDTVAGSSLRYAGAGTGNLSGTSGTGTWRCMGASSFNTGALLALNDLARRTLWLRIS